MKNGSDQVVSLINPKNYRRSPGPTEGARSLATMASIHEVARKTRSERGFDQIWAWEDRRTVNKTHEIIWQMTGEWKARRNVTIRRPQAFHDRVQTNVTRLARAFNRHRLRCMRDFRRLNKSEYTDVFFEIIQSVQQVSKARKTQLIKPVLGSKVLHHYFPSIVPVFDDYYISKEVLKTKSFKRFCEGEMAKWCPCYNGSLRPRMEEYAAYLAYCISRVCTTDATVMKRFRRRLGNDSKAAFPFSVVGDKKNHFLWKLDAKLVEYCLLGSL